MPKSGVYDVFVSYSHNDRDLVRPLVELLGINGHRVFWDEHSLKPGQVWPEEIERAVVTCRRFLLIWCCDTHESRYVAEELNLAINHNRVIIPVLLCPLPPPDSIKDRQWIDLRGRMNHICREDEELTSVHESCEVNTASLAKESSKKEGIAAGAAAGAIVGLTILGGVSFAVPPAVPLLGAVGALLGGLVGATAGAVGRFAITAYRNSDDKDLDSLIRGYFDKLAARTG